MPQHEQIRQLENNQIHLWYCQPSLIVDPLLLHNYLSLLNESELARYRRFHFEKDKHRHLVTRALIRSTLSFYDPTIAPTDWVFSHNEFGKPSIASATSKLLNFNISHSNDFVVAAVTAGTTVGVDVENIKERSNLDGLAKHCFNEAEQAYIFADNSEHMQNRFFQLWTLKESYIKAFGKGLAISLKDMSFSICPNKIDLKFTGKHQDEASIWRFFCIKPADDYQMAVTVAQDQAPSLNQIKLIHSVPLKPITSILEGNELTKEHE